MEKNAEKPVMHRRKFLKLTGVAGLGMAIGAFWVGDGIAAIPVSRGFLLLDTKKCAGCMTCMLACSLVHDGEHNLSLARIQVLQNPYGKFPRDIRISQCRQCVEPACVAICPVEAMHVDSEHGNVRIVDTEKCIGCGQCFEACPHSPKRVTLDSETGTAVKCDLCVDTPHWKEKGGPDGKRACEDLCPMRAIKFSTKVPPQDRADSYETNLRGPAWEHIGFFEQGDNGRPRVGSGE